jgi:hypothetical protein
MQTITTPDTPTTPPPAGAVPAAEPSKLDLATTKIQHAARMTDDESIINFTWSRRDDVCRLLDDALRLIREAKEEGTSN